MKKKINILHFVPYYLPHIGGLENFVYEFSVKRAYYGCGSSVVLTSNIGQNFEKSIAKKDLILDKCGQVIGYKRENTKVYSIPSFELIKNFPIPKFWDKRFFTILRSISKEENDIIITHTRFFIYTLLGVLFSKFYNIRSVHIEHGSDFVLLKNSLFTFLAYLYDIAIGRIVLKTVNEIVSISNATSKFMSEKFNVDSKHVIYRGYNDFYKELDKDSNIKIVFIGRLVKLKGVELLIDVYQELSKNDINIELFVFGDGPERDLIEIYITKNEVQSIHLLGYKNIEYIQNFLLNHKCVILMPSLQEGLGTVAIEGLLSKNIVVASDAGGIKEVSHEGDLLIFESGNKYAMVHSILSAIQNYDSLSGISHNLVKEKFSRERNIKQYKLLFESILSKQSKEMH